MTMIRDEWVRGRARSEALHAGDVIEAPCVPVSPNDDLSADELIQKYYRWWTCGAWHTQGVWTVKLGPVSFCGYEWNGRRQVEIIGFGGRTWYRRFPL